MATKKEDAPVEAFVLRDCVFGRAGDVVEVSASDAKTGAEQGMLDLAQSAVRHAKSEKAK